MLDLGASCSYLSNIPLYQILELTSSLFRFQPPSDGANHTITAAEGAYALHQLQSLIVDSRYADAVDNDGQTLILPILQQFAETFQEDLQSSLGIRIPLLQGVKASPNSIFLTLDKDAKKFKDAAGRSTSEGYSLTVNENGIVIAGSSPLGTWWGTRSVVQAAVVSHDLSISHGFGIDAPGWATRGVMVCMLVV